MPMLPASNPTVNGGGDSPAALTSLPSDVLTRIFHLLDGPSLAAISCVSSQLHALSSDPSLWHRLCRATWPSSDQPHVSHIVSAAFPYAHRSFFSDAFPLLPLHPVLPRHPSPPHQLMSAVDLRHRSTPIFSMLVETETRTGWFFSSPFRIDAVDRKDPPLAVAALSPDSLAADLTLSWIVIDPARGRAANVSSLRPVSVQRHWFSGEIQARFAAVVAREREGEWAACSVVVACGERGEKGGGLQLREVSMAVEDMDGMSLNGRDSMVILQGAMEGRRTALGKGRDKEKVMRERYLEFLERKKERKERKMRREGRLDLACILMGVSVFASFLGWIFSSWW